MTYFIVGTDTDVGKSFITAALAISLLREGVKLGVQKWLSTGAKGKSLDIEYIKKAVIKGVNKKKLQNLKLSSPYTFSFPASPHLAAEIEGKDIDKNRLFEESIQLKEKTEILLIEGIGGLMVPINKNELLIDLIKEIKCHVILVARAGLGTINHTLLSVEALKHRNIKLHSLILNDIGFLGQKDLSDSKIKEDNKKIIEHFSKIPIYGPIPYGKKPWDIEVQKKLKPLIEHLLKTDGNKQ